MTPEAVQLTLSPADWSLGERATVFGHVAEASRDGHRLSVAARTSAIARLAVWAKLTRPSRAGE